MPNAPVSSPSVSELTADTKKDPDRWIRAASWLVVAFSLIQVLAFSFGRDQGIYGVIAEGMLRGELPYRDLWDFKPPGIFFVYAGSFALFGKSMMAPRIVEVLMLLGSVLSLRRLGGVFFQSRSAGMLAGAIFALLHAQLDFWHTGQPESFAGPLSLYALVITTSHWKARHEVYAWISIGILFGCAFVLKPPFGGGAIACALYLLVKRRRQGRSSLASASPFLTIGFASTLPIIACCTWFWAKDGWPALNWTLFEFAPGYTALSWVGRDPERMFFHAVKQAFFGLSSLLAFGVIAAAAIHPRARGERQAYVLILGVLFFQLLGITIQGKFFQYHYGASLPFIALIAGQGYYKLWRRLAPDSPKARAIYALILTLCASLHLPVNDTPGSFWERSASRMRYIFSLGTSLSRAELDERLHYVGGYNLHIVRQAALELKKHVAPGAYTYVWGFEPALYSLSQTRPSSRYIYNVPQRAKWQSERAKATLLKDLQRNPPAAVITQRRDAMHFVTGNRFDSTDSLPNFPALEHWLHQHFKQAKTIDRFALWLPREGRPGVAGNP